MRYSTRLRRWPEPSKQSKYCITLSSWFGFSLYSAAWGCMGNMTERVVRYQLHCVRQHTSVKIHKLFTGWRIYRTCWILNICIQKADRVAQSFFFTKCCLHVPGSWHCKYNPTLTVWLSTWYLRSLAICNWTCVITASFDNLLFLIHSRNALLTIVSVFVEPMHQNRTSTNFINTENVTNKELKNKIYV